METTTIGQSSLRCSRLSYGCMRIAGDGGSHDRNKGKRAVRAAIDAGYTLFDHADIYGNSVCEELFGEISRESPRLREHILVASKCGIRKSGDPDKHAPARYDFSRQHITRSVDASLALLSIEQLDLFLLHRPDCLMQADK